MSVIASLRMPDKSASFPINARLRTRRQVCPVEAISENPKRRTVDIGKCIAVDCRGAGGCHREEIS